MQARLGLRDDWRRQLRLVRDALGTESVRFHGIFDDDMGSVVVHAAPASPVPYTYNFTAIAAVLDFIVNDLHMRPFVELSFMPGALASGSRTYLQYKVRREKAGGVGDLWCRNTHTCCVYEFVVGYILLGVLVYERLQQQYKLTKVGLPPPRTSPSRRTSPLHGT
jgi:beta-xylosidase